MPRPVLHIVGAGLAGLAAAVRLAEDAVEIVLHEATDHAGGRCRSYYEPALDQVIDNGNHLLLSANHAALGFLRRIGAENALLGPTHASFDFADLADGGRWRILINDGRLPWWIFSARARVPGTGALDYLGAWRLLTAGPEASIAEVMACRGRVYDRLLRPLLLAALNTEPEPASARLAGTILKETLLKGGEACRPLVAARGLSAAFVDPALAWLQARGVALRFGHRLRRIVLAEGRASALDFGEEAVALAPGDGVILALPAPVAKALLPEITAPESFRAILNAHFKIDAPPGWPALLGVIGGTVEWLFAFENRLSITISGADRLIDRDREELARELWGEVAALTGLGPSLPAWQIVKERRATFAALPAEEARRPGAETRWPNLRLAGDWTATGLPATIEGAIRSGNRAAESLLSKGL
ncbi:MAG TPA: hydroxysqualene dehydroxylase HpnE [Verrucomicrobiae bacterium]|nr:hydroxysqualene dehydroxylase HpnE [Verrucomicrobiae bacterium]